MAAPFLQSHSEEIVQELAKLRADIDVILAHWRGGANKYFQDLKAEWDYAGKGLFEDVLGRIAHALHINWINSNNGEQDNMRSWRPSS